MDDSVNKAMQKSKRKIVDDSNGEAKATIAMHIYNTTQGALFYPITSKE